MSRKKKTSMSFLTSLSLSANNLRTKKGRTFMTSLAGSIGIIGIALILALSSGVNAYIQSIEEETLSEYPLQITKSQLDLTSLMNSMSDSSTGEKASGDSKEEIEVTEIINSLFSEVKTNDLKSLKEYLESGKSDIHDYVTSIEYLYDVTPEIYDVQDDTVRKVNPDTTLNGMYESTSGGMFSSMGWLASSTSSFYMMPDSEDLYKGKYDIKAGRWAEQYDEAVLVLTEDGRISDYMLYPLGLRDYDELEQMVDDYVNGDETRPVEDIGSYLYKDVLGKSYKVVSPSKYYHYDETYGIWIDKTEDKEYLSSIVNEGMDLTIVGVVQPMVDASGANLTSGINYTPELVRHMAEISNESEVVAAQMESPDRNILTGESFDSEMSSLDLSSMFSFDTGSLDEIFNTDSLAGSLDLDLSSLPMEMSLPDLGSLDLSSLNLENALDLSSLQNEQSQEQMENLTRELIRGYLTYLIEDSGFRAEDYAENFNEYISSDAITSVLNDYLRSLASEREVEVSTEELRSVIENAVAKSEEDGDTSDQVDLILAAISEYIGSREEGSFDIQEADLAELADSILSGYENFELSNDSSSMKSLSDSFTEYLNLESTQQLIRSNTSSMMEAAGGISINESVTAAITQQLTVALQESMSGAINSMMESMKSSIADSLTIDESALSDMLNVNIDSDYLADMLTSMQSSIGTTYESNLTSLGYVDFDNPSEIDIYPVDFESKEAVVEILDAYNDQVKGAGQEEKAISYTDISATMMSSISTIVNVITYVLIAFVAVSLIVSCIMISIITQISVMERTKEIGVLRAMGASKRNVSQIFIAETFIIGSASGILGIVITELLIVPVNMLIRSLVEDASVSAVLPPGYAVILILISIGITVLSGLIPAFRAARQDPVTALRSE